MVFDKPQWRWLGAEEEQCVAGLVHNRVLAIDPRGRESTALVVVPTEFYPFLQQIEPPARIEAARGGKGVSFYIEAYEGRWIFGYFMDTDPTDLWYYTGEKVPHWASQGR